MTSDNVIPDGLSRSKWIQNYVKDRKENLYSLDEFAQLKLMDLERMNRRKMDYRKSTAAIETESPTQTTEEEEFDAAIPDIKEHEAHDVETDRKHFHSKTDTETNGVVPAQIPPTPSGPPSTTSASHTAPPPHINLKNQVTDHSLRIALYIDLLQMISERIPKHSQLLQFLSSELGKYVIDGHHVESARAHNKENKENDEAIKFSALCRMPSLRDSADHYKLKYEALLRQIADGKREKEVADHQVLVNRKLQDISLSRVQHLKTYFKEWRAMKNVRKFQASCTRRRKLSSWQQWRSAYRQSRWWNFESTIDGLKNDLSHSEMYKDLYMQRNEALIEQITQYKQALVTCVDAVNRNEFCGQCMSSWHSQCHEYLSSIKFRHAFISNLLQ